MKLTSFNDLKIPSGLFPIKESSFIEHIALTALQSINFKSIEKLNDVLIPLVNMFDKDTDILSLFNSPDLPEIIKSAMIEHINGILYPIDWDKIPDDFRVESPDSIATELIKELLNEPELLGLVPQGVEPIELIKRTAIIGMPLFSLATYVIGLEKARQFEIKDLSDRAKYCRLGMSLKYFYLAKNLIELSHNLLTELSAIEHTVDKEKSIRSNRSSKAGSKSYQAQRPIQQLCIKEYVAAKKKNAKLVKSHFVHNFVKNLSENQKHPFSPSNIEQNLLRQIGKYEKGIISSSMLTRKN